MFYFVPEIVRIYIITSNWQNLLVTTAVIFLLILVFIFLTYKTDAIIDFFGLDKGFDDDQIILGNLGMRKILNFAVIIIGFMLIINNLSMFLEQIFLAFKKNIPSSINRPVWLDLEKHFDWYYLIYSSISILTGYLILTNYDTLSKYLYKSE